MKYKFALNKEGDSVSEGNSQSSVTLFLLIISAKKFLKKADFCKFGNNSGILGSAGNPLTDVLLSI